MMMPNLPEYMLAIAAVLRVGCVVVNVNPLYTARELEHQLVDSGAEAIVVLEKVSATLEEVIDRTRVRHVFNLACESGSQLNLRRADLTPDDVAFLQYTGGTTGLSTCELLSGQLHGVQTPQGAIEFLDELPKSNLGRILRRELRSAA